MLQIQETIVSFDVVEQQFCCDLSACKGICCIEGDEGAPLEPEEVAILEGLVDTVWEDLTEASREVILRQGVSYIDKDNEPVTSIVNGAECVFSYTDTAGICKCAIEKAYREGRTDFYKPISCHLYPIRLQRYNRFTAVNYHQWSVCTDARRCGNRLGLPLYRFLKEPLVRRFGTEWYDQLEAASKEWLAQKTNHLERPL